MRIACVLTFLAVATLSSPQLVADDDPTYLIIGYAKNEDGGYIGHVTFGILKSDWSEIGRDEVAFKVGSEFDASSISHVVVPPGECYVMYTQQQGNGIKRVYRATSSNEDDFRNEKSRVDELLEKYPNDGYKYVEDGCNNNTKVEKIKTDAPESFDAFADSFQGVTLEAGAFRCKGRNSANENVADFTVKRVRPGLYYFQSLKNGTNNESALNSYSQ